MHQRLRRPTILLALAAALLWPAATADAADTPNPIATPADAVAQLAVLLNQDRAAAGLVPYQLDSRLMAIATERAEAMASSGDFSHVGPDGRTAFDMIETARIAWYGAGEIIAWNSWPALADSVVQANTGWMNSEVHRDLILATTDNYMGIGVATAVDGKHYWAVEFMRGPDRTGAWARMTGASATRATTAAVVRVSWTGGDVPLAALTSGLRDFQLQRRADGGAWVGVTSATASRTWTLRLAPGHSYGFRVRARDMAGNYGAWTSPASVTA